MKETDKFFKKYLENQEKHIEKIGNYTEKLNDLIIEMKSSTDKNDSLIIEKLDNHTTILDKIDKNIYKFMALLISIIATALGVTKILKI